MRLLNWIFALAVCLLAVNAHAAPKPNVLFIAVDDLNDWIGCIGGHPQALTPNMDRLAKRGVLFTNAHCAAPACNPSRAAVFSGLMPARTGVWSNNSARIEKASPKAVLLTCVSKRRLSNAGHRQNAARHCEEFVRGILRREPAVESVSQTPCLTQKPSCPAKARTILAMCSGIVVAVKWCCPSTGCHPTANRIRPTASRSTGAGSMCRTAISATRKSRRGPSTG